MLAKLIKTISDKIAACVGKTPAQADYIPTTEPIITLTKEVLVSRIKWQDLSMSREITYASEFNDSIQENLILLAEKMTELETAYGKKLVISSGWRPAGINKKVGGASSSSHLRGAAVDIADADCKFWEFCISNLELISKLALFLEDKRYSPTWTHLQLTPPKSGKRIFIPNSNPAPNPELWDGKYDSKYDQRS